MVLIASTATPPAWSTRVAVAVYRAGDDVPQYRSAPGANRSWTGPERAVPLNSGRTGAVVLEARRTPPGPHISNRTEASDESPVTSCHSAEAVATSSEPGASSAATKMPLSTNDCGGARTSVTARMIPPPPYQCSEPKDASARIAMTLGPPQTAAETLSRRTVMGRAVKQNYRMNAVKKSIGQPTRKGTIRRRVSCRWEIHAV